MKKIFTLIAAAFMAVSANASVQLASGSSSWGSWGSTCTVDGATITFSSAWAGAGVWFNETMDLSSYEMVWAVLSTECVGSAKFVFQYISADEEASDLAIGQEFTISEGGKIGGVEVKANNDADLTKFRQVFAQSTVANTTIVIEGVYAGTKEEYEAAAEANKQVVSGLTLTDLNSGWGSSTYDADTHTVTIGDDWSGKGWWLSSVDYSDYDVVVISFDPATATNGKIVIEYNNGTASTEYAFEAGTTQAVVTLDAAGKGDVMQIYIQGPAGSTYTLTEAYVSTSAYAGVQNVTTATEVVEDANAPVYNVAGQQVSKSYKGLVIKNGKKYIVR